VAWIADRFQVDAQGEKSTDVKADFCPLQTPYFWPTQQWPVEDTDYAIYLAKRNIRKKGILELHEQEQYNRLHKWMNHKWDFIVMQAKEQYRAAKERKKPDRVVFDCQERAYWVVHRPPPGTVSAMDYGLDRRVDPNANEVTVGLQTLLFAEMKRLFSSNMIRSDMIFHFSCRLVKYCATYNSHDPFLSKCLPSNPWLTDDVTYWTLNMPNVEIPTKMRVERWTFSFGELLSDPRGRDDFRLFLKKEFSGENLAFWEGCEDLKWGTAVTMREKAEQIYKTFLARGAPRWINIDGKTMEITVSGLRHPHRYVLDAAQTHIYMLMKKVSKHTRRFVKDKLPHDLEQNARNRRPSLSPIILRQQELEQRAKMAASAPVDITQLCRFTTPVSHLAVYSGFTDSPSANASPSLPFVAPTPVCPSPISVALDSNSASERRAEAGEGEAERNPEARAPAGGNVLKSRMALSLRRLLKRGCSPSTMFASLSPKGQAAAGTSRIQPLCPDQPSQAPPRRTGNFFQIKVDIPPECRIYPIESEDEEEENRASSRGGVGAKEIICPWESLTPQNGTG
uniref:Regulator of G protein signaling 9b n=1 Tax=Echeneis naucrates TaxID=173247 RepID=A0A665VNS6_ECHNA